MIKPVPLRERKKQQWWYFLVLNVREWQERGTIHRQYRAIRPQSGHMEKENPFPEELKSSSKKEKNSTPKAKTLKLQAMSSVKVVEGEMALEEEKTLGELFRKANEYAVIKLLK